MTINAALVHLKILKQRHSELVALRDGNANKERRFYGSTEKEVVKEPTYDVRKLDLRIVNLTREQRKLELAIKNQNALTEVEGYTADESVLDGIE